MVRVPVHSMAELPAKVDQLAPGKLAQKQPSPSGRRHLTIDVVHRVYDTYSRFTDAPSKFARSFGVNTRVETAVAPASSPPVVLGDSSPGTATLQL